MEKHSSTPIGDSALGAPVAQWCSLNTLISATGEAWGPRTGGSTRTQGWPAAPEGFWERVSVAGPMGPHGPGRPCSDFFLSRHQGISGLRGPPGPQVSDALDTISLSVHLALTSH